MLAATTTTLDAARSPFALHEDGLYAAWRARKLAARPASAGDLVVEVRDPRRLSPAEREALVDRCRRANMAIYATPDGAGEDRELARELARQLGLVSLDSNLLAEPDGLTAIQVNSDNSSRGYIPYTRHRLLWHTDGYYNPPQRTIRGMLLHCVHPGSNGGENGLIDPELVYIFLRDRDPALVAALMHPEAMVVPPNEEAPEAGRGEQGGPVFAIDARGNLHMRYTHRTRSIRWRDTPETAAARAALVDLLDAVGDHVWRVTLQSGQGIVCNNVLHNRTAFEQGPGPGRLVFRGRYYERVTGTDTADLLAGA